MTIRGGVSTRRASTQAERLAQVQQSHRPGWRLSVAAMGIFAFLAGCSDRDAGDPFAPVTELAVDASIAAPGLAGPADVIEDELGVQHVYGPDAVSVLFVQGYVTASQRFWEMDVFRRFAEGRLSELFGAFTVSTDISNRTVFTTRDGRRIEDALWERLQAESPDSARLAQAYADGINLWLAHLRAGRNGATLPPEYGFAIIALGADQLEDWRPEDTLAIARLQAYQLSETLGEEIGRAETWAALPEDLRRDVYRSAPAAPATVLPYDAERVDGGPAQPLGPAPAGAGGGARRSASVAAGGSSAAADAGVALPSRDVLRAISRHLDEVRQWSPMGGRDADRSVGSNNWIVSPGMSTTGHAMMANDPHLQLFNPPIWHMVHLEASGHGPGSPDHMRVNGVQFPGLPGVILGHNADGAWGGTVAGYDVTDVYVETVTTPADYPASPRTVLFQGRQVPVRRIEERFRVKGQPDQIHVIEVVPHHGPMVPDPDPSDDVEGIAATSMSVRWTGHEITLDSLFLTEINRARNAAEFKNAIRDFAVGAQNWVWADVHGDIAYFPRVLIPRRPAGTVPYLPMSGAGDAEWLTDGNGATAWLTEDEIPQATNPEAGYLATANNDQLGTTLDNDPLNGPVYYAFDFDLGFREQRIQEMLAGGTGLRPAGSKMSPADLSRYQYDVQSKEAERLVPFLLAAAQARPDRVSSAMADAIARLREWGTGRPGLGKGDSAYDMVSGVDPAATRPDVEPRPKPPSSEEIRDSQATSIFVGFTTRLSRILFGPAFAGTGVGTPGGQEATKALLHLLEDTERTDPGFRIWTRDEDGQSRLWRSVGIPGVSGRDEVLLEALRQALEFLATKTGSGDPADWRWGDIHPVRFEHFFGQGGLPLFDLFPFPAPGGRFTVDPAGFSLNSDDFEFAAGPSMRLVVDLDPAGITAVNALPGGNNGNPGGTAAENFGRIDPEIHYGDHIPGWIDGQTFALHWEVADVARSNRRHTRFEP